jgi:prepilin-type N-terminal cleavage/methylation domain-containing protein
MKIRHENQAAFSLVELLVVLVIVAILAGLLLPILDEVRLRGDRVTALGQMRQIEAALLLYPADHNGLLPGPLFPGQLPMLDPTRNGRLVLSLAPYLGITIPLTPQLIPLFIPPAYKRDVTAAFLTDARTYVMNMAVPSPNGTTIFNPWGNAATGVGLPSSLAQVPGQIWAFSDADQLHPRVIGTSWQANTPDTIIHGSERLAVFFDGSAGPIDASQLAVPTP